MTTRPADSLFISVKWPDYLDTKKVQALANEKGITVKAAKEELFNGIQKAH